MQRYRHGRVVVHEVDITQVAVDAIVCWATPKLSGLGTVERAIHEAAGPELGEACRELKGCEPGECKVTAGFRLPAKWVVHCVPPIWQGGRADEDEILRRCYEVAVWRAMEHGATTVAFAALGGAYPKERAAQIAISTVLESLEQHASLEGVTFCCASEVESAIYESVAEEYL